MTHDEFLELLKKAHLNKKEFVELNKLAYSTVGNWSTTNNVPYWVKSWLENYISKKKFDNIKNIIKDEI